MLLYWWYLWFKWIGCSAPELLEFMIICPGFCLTFYRKCCWPTSFHVRFLACIFYSHILWICYLYPLRLLCLFYSKAVIILFLLCSSLLTSFKSDWNSRSWSIECSAVAELHQFLLVRFMCHYCPRWAPLIAQLVKDPPAMQETLVQFLGQEDLLEKG